VLESCARVTIGPRRWNSYFACGFTGYLVGLALTSWLAGRAGFGVAPRLCVAIGPPVAFLIAVAVSSAIAGYERIVFYEKALVSIGFASIAAWIAGAPLLVAVDATTLGIGTFLAFGRMGCLRVGCCHGRPARWGIRYGHAHVEAGFEARLRDVPLVPIQIVDGAVSAALTIAGVIIATRGAPGHASALYLAGYGVSRFTLELARGDDRPYGLGLSEAQWTALVTSWIAVALWPAIAIAACAGLITLGAGALLFARRRDWPRAYWLANPNHLREVHAALIAGAAEAKVTQEGLRVSTHALPDGRIDLIASHEARPLTPAPVRAMAAQLGRYTVDDVVAGRTPGLLHVLLRPVDPP
jgi:prolipoprotein diacylglyceryltransferase